MVVEGFEETGPYLVLAHPDGAHLLWPLFVVTPAGWRVVYGPDARQPCRDHLDRRGRAVPLAGPR